MMSMSPVSGGSAAASYYSSDNYYTLEQSAESSEWVGKGAQELGLTGQVDEQVFAEILDGKLPNGDVIEAPNGEHRAGLDLTFSASKSVSLLALLGDDTRIEAAMKESVEVTLAWAEENLIEARVWNKQEARQEKEKTGNLVAATFAHDVNRNGEPQLHIHAVVINATKASDGKWHAVHNDELYKHQHLLGAIQNAELRSRLEAMGYETVPAKNPIDGAFEISGIDRKVVEAYSTRSAEIKAHLAADGRSSPRERELAALATRSAKESALSPEQRKFAWKATAERVGFDPAPLVAASIAREASRDTVWSRLSSTVRGAGAQGMAMLSAMKMTPKDGDELVPERMGRLAPREFAAAQAVASAARELGENEAAYSRNDLLLKSLERYGPITVKDIEARIDTLIDKKLLVAGEQLMTKPMTIAQEQRVIIAAREGNNAVQPIATGTDVASRLQIAAKDIGLRRLNEGQVNAGIDVLTSTNRVHLIQGGAGVGKSAALAPVAAIARSEGHNVIALSHVGRMAREFGEKVGENGMTVDRFLGSHSSILTGKASADRIAEARANLNGAVIMVDEASQIGTARFGKLVDLANTMGAARLIFAGDTRQLPAIEAGKPFERLQNEGQGTSIVTENLRAKSPQMITLNASLEAKDYGKAFEILAPDTVTVARGEVAQTAANIWVNLDKAERDQTLLLTSSRAMRSTANEAAQMGLRDLGEIGAKGIKFTVLDRINIGLEGARQLRGYQEGRIVEFSSNLKSQGFAKGERGKVVDIEGGKVELRMPGGVLRKFDPSRLPRNLSRDAVVIFEQKQITLHEGDRIRWTASDNTRDFRNGDISHIKEVSQSGFTFETRDGQLHTIGQGDKMSDRLDLAYAINVHVAQGVSEKLGIAMMAAREKMLNSGQAFLAAVTRFAEKVTLVVDDPSRVERDVIHNPGGKTSAIEATQNGPATEANDFGSGQNRPQIEPLAPPEIEKSRDFDMGM